MNWLAFDLLTGIRIGGYHELQGHGCLFGKWLNEAFRSPFIEAVIEARLKIDNLPAPPAIQPAV
jgi:hypothetical protein